MKAVAFGMTEMYESWRFFHQKDANFTDFFSHLIMSHEYKRSVDFLLHENRLVRQLILCTHQSYYIFLEARLLGV